MRFDELTSGATRSGRRAAPTLLAGVLATGYLVAAPRSPDLAAALFRAKLFGAEGFGLWDNWWYAGHNVPGYSLLFPALAWLLSPQLVAAAAAVLSALAFEKLAHRRFGDGAWVGATWFAAATVTTLLSGRLTFALGLLGVVVVALALAHERPWLAAGCAVLTALASPVAALFAALMGGAYAFADGGDLLGGGAVVVAALAPVGALALAFPEGGREPFALSALLPVPVLCAALLALAPRRDRALRAGLVLYGLGCVVAYLAATPVGGNATRLGVLVAGPLAALLMFPDRRRLLLACAPALLYLQWHGAVTDVVNATTSPSTTAAYYRPLLRFLTEQPGPPFRIEIPFTAEHWEAYEVAPRISLARGWERQLDVANNGLFYGAHLTAHGYDAWLRRLAVRFVALPDAALDASAVREARLIRAGLPYLRLVFRSPHWRVYAVADPIPIVTGAATLTALGPNSATLAARRAGSALVRIRWSPYWRLTGVPGCVAPAGKFVSVRFRRAGRAALVIDFALDRIGARSQRCD